MDEMVEHSFYQGINLAQAVFLHSMGWEVVSTHPLARAIALLLVTLPWAARGR